MICSEVPRSQQRQIARAVQDLFGTPDEPAAARVTGLDLGRLRTAAGRVRGDGVGGDVGLYRRHCASCHGVTGDGYGPRSALLNPYPRDFTEATFKFKSTETSRRPTTADLRRILDRGIPGTAMPSFGSLTQEKKVALIEYVMYLSMRGQMEVALAHYCTDELDEEDSLNTAQKSLMDELLAPIAAAWRGAPQHVIEPPEQVPSRRDRSSAERGRSVANGRALFYGKRANCFTCHDESTPALEQSDQYADQYDDWNKQVRQFLDSYGDIDTGGLVLLSPRKIVPRNLRSGVFRGGPQPVDLYRRIHAGIDGTPMPAVGPLVTGREGVLAPAEIWSLVDYLQQLPTEPADSTDGRSTGLAGPERTGTTLGGVTGAID